MTPNTISFTKLALYFATLTATAFVATAPAAAATNNEGMQLLRATVTNNTGIDAQLYVAIVGNAGSQEDGDYVVYQATGSNGDVTSYSKSNPSISLGYPIKLKANRTARFKIPQLQSARVYFSFHSPINSNVTKTSYSPPYTGTFYAIGSPTGWTPTGNPNYSTPFDWIEYSWNPGSGSQAMYVDTTQVDMYGLPIKLIYFYQSPSTNKNTNTSVGAKKNTWQKVFSAFVGAGSPWKNLLVTQHGHTLSPLRIIAPAHGINTPPFNFPEDQLDSYIDDVFNYYKNEELTIEWKNGTYVGKTGTVNNKTAIIFNGSNSDAISKPTTSQVYMNTIPSTAPGGVTDLFAASLLRSTLLKDSTPSDCNTKTYYKYPPVDMYAKIFHRYSIGNLAYAMPYDDNCNQSTTVSGVPNKLKIVLQPMVQDD